MLTLLFLYSLAFAQVDHTPYVTCPMDGTVYDGRDACPGECVPVPEGANVRLMKCKNGALSIDASKKTAHDAKVAQAASKAADRASDIDTLKRSTNPEIRALIKLLEEK